MFYIYKKISRIKVSVFILLSMLINGLKFFFLGVKYKSFPRTRGILKLFFSTRNSLTLGKNVIINSGKNMNPVGLGIQTIFLTLGTGKIVIGDNVGMSNVTIAARSKITIENNVMLGSGVIIYDNDFHSLNYANRIFNDSDIKTKPVKISEGAFIGAGTFILKGVTIGKHSVIGAGSVVTHSVPDNQLWAGNPAVFIRTL